MDFLSIHNLFAQETEEKFLNLKELLLAFSSKSNIFSILDRSFDEGFLVTPSPFSNNFATCFLCFRNRYLFQGFSDECSEFYIVHHQRYCQAVLIPSWNIIVCSNEKLAENILDRFYLLNDSLKKEVNPIAFQGILNGYSRPYHYFYDRLPFLVSYLQSTYVKEVKVIDLVNGAFVGAPDFCFSNIEFEVTDDLSSIDGSFFPMALPNRLGSNSSDDKAELGSQLVRWFHETHLQLDKGVSSGLTVWLGVASEKRSVDGLVETVVMFISKVLEWRPDTTFIFDGLTKPVYVSRADFLNLKRVKQDIDLVNQIKDEVERSVRADINTFITSIIGCESIEKFNIAMDIDFFLSSALTDSMWPAKFANKPGVCWTGGNFKKIKKEHVHPRTRLLSPGEGFSVLGEYSEENFKFDPITMSQLWFEQLKQSSE